jgi:peptidylprolyl isomerase
MLPTRRLILSAAVLSSLALAACGSSSNDSSSSASASTPAPTTAASTPAATAATPTATPTPASSSSAKKPTIHVPHGKPPTHLVIKDLKKGHGAEAKAGDNVTVQYVGVLYSNGKQFDASWDRGQPFSFPLGAGQVIPGWDKGVVGMRVGGRRELIIPPADGYGAQGSPPTIPANSTLIFDVDLVSVG